MGIYTKQSGTWRTLRTPYVEINTGGFVPSYTPWSYSSIVHVKESGTWKTTFPMGVFSTLSATMSTSHSGGGSSNSESGSSATFFGGFNGNFHTQLATTNEYNGSSFSTGGNLNTARMYLGSTGSAASPLAWCGHQSTSSPTTWTFFNTTEEYTASTSTWTNTSTTYVFQRPHSWLVGGAGTQAAALGFAGQYESGGNFYGSDYTREYNGFFNQWFTGGSMPYPAYNRCGCGTQTAAVAFGGFENDDPNRTSPQDQSASSPTYTAAANRTIATYDGTSWTSFTNNIEFDRSMNWSIYRRTASGTQSACLMFSSEFFSSPSIGITRQKQAYEFDNITLAVAGFTISERQFSQISGGLSSNGIIAGGRSSSQFLTSAEIYTRYT